MADEIRVDDEFFDVETISLEVEGGKVIECAILDEFDALGRTYVALAPINEDDTLGDETFLYRCHDDGDDYIDLEYIDDEKELTEVAKIYEDLCNEEIDAE